VGGHAALGADQGVEGEARGAAGVDADHGDFHHAVHAGVEAGGFEVQDGDRRLRHGAAEEAAGYGRHRGL